MVPGCLAIRTPPNEWTRGKDRPGQPRAIIPPPANRSFACSDVPSFVVHPSAWQWDESLYAGSAAHYGVGRMPYSPSLADAIRRELGLDGTGRLLDVGCGPGSRSCDSRLHRFDPDRGRWRAGGGSRHRRDRVGRFLAFRIGSASVRRPTPDLRGRPAPTPEVRLAKRSVFRADPRNRGADLATLIAGLAPVQKVAFTGRYCKS